MTEIESSDDNFEFRFRCEKRTAKIFERLHSLIQAGYNLDLSPDVVDAFWLRHSSKEFKHSSLIVYASGLVLSSNENTDEFRFYLDDEERFKRFLHQVPRPTWWDRSRDSRETIWGFILAFGGLFIFGWTADWVLGAIGRMTSP
jgi:hypothetical protein